IPPALDGPFVPLDGAPDRHLGCPAQFLEEPGHVALVVVNTELFLDDPGDAGAGPDVPAEAVGLRPVPEEFREQTLLGGRELGRVAWRGVRPQRLGTTVAGADEPTADGLLGDAQGVADVALIPARPLEDHSPQPSPLAPDVWDEVLSPSLATSHSGLR